jgi:hypothetical protein
VSKVLEKTKASVCQIKKAKEGFQAFQECGQNFFNLIITKIETKKRKANIMISLIRQFEKENKQKLVPILILSGKLPIFLKIAKGKNLSIVTLKRK